MAAAAAGGGECWVRAGGRQRLRAAATACVGLQRAAAPQTPRSGSPRGRAPETKRSDSQGAAGVRPVGQRGAGQRVPANVPEPGRPARPEGGKMPRVVPDQRSKFENEEFFRKLSRECEVRRAGGAEAAARPREWARAEKSLGGAAPPGAPRRRARGGAISPGEPPARRLCLPLIGAARGGGRARGRRRGFGS